MGAAWPHKLVFRVKRRLKSIFSCNQKTAIKRKHKTATQHSGRDLERRSKGAGRWRYFVPQAQNNAGTKRTLLRRDKMLQYRYFKFSIGYLEDHPTALLGRGAFAPHECFAAGKTSAQGEFISPEQFKGPQVSKKEAPAMQVLLFCVPSIKIMLGSTIRLFSALFKICAKISSLSSGGKRLQKA